MSFHSATFELLGHELRPNSAALAEIEQAERRVGFRLPASIREWYGCDEAISVLAKYSNQDPPIPLSDFAPIEWQLHRLLPFRYENQGVCTWAIALDGTDDPPVYVEVDSAGREWNPHAPSFSKYIYSSVWDYKLVFGQPVSVQSQNSELTPQAVAFLSAEFEPELETRCWPGNIQYRFKGEGQYILIWSGETQADWWVAATDERSLELAIKTVWNIDSVGDSFWDSSDSQIGKQLLDRIRSTQ
jgi:hypothetical protein